MSFFLSKKKKFIVTCLPYADGEKQLRVKRDEFASQLSVVARSAQAQALRADASRIPRYDVTVKEKKVMKRHWLPDLKSVIPDAKI